MLGVWPRGASSPRLSEKGSRWLLERVKLGSPAYVRRTVGGESHSSPLLEVTDVIGESPVVKVSLNGVEIACLIDTGSQITTIARPAYEAHFPTTLYESSATWVNLKAAKNSSNETLRVIQVDVELCGWTVKKKGEVVVQEAMEPQVPIILGMNVLQELDRHIAQ